MKVRTVVVDGIVCFVSAVRDNLDDGQDGTSVEHQLDQTLEAEHGTRQLENTSLVQRHG